MKYTKANYFIIGRFENGGKYGIITRQEVTGYTVDGLDGIAIKKRGGFWYVDHVSTGLGVVTIGCKTRDAAVKEYTERYKSVVESTPADYFKKAIETFENAPLESDVATWESVNFCTTRNYRFDRVTNAAHRAGLITKKADDVSYLDGGNINIIGRPEDLEPIKEMIRAWEEHDAEKAAAERAENISEVETKVQEVENVSDYTFTATTLTCKGKTFPCEYNIIADGSVLAFVILGVNENGYKQKQRIHFKPDHADHAAALAAATVAKETGARPEIVPTGYKKTATAAGNIIEKAEEIAAETVQEEKRAERNPKAARGPVPEKSFIGETIQGDGWKIFFDGEASRTRIIFEDAPKKSALDALAAAGFYYSSVMDSWNKKLTFKAYRAAKTLAGELAKIYTNAA
ncbi:MAG: hypothetical protein IJT66_05210 [Clostridia bacterium]|nr:hypothetical protein [Clostridia bacterium]